MNLFIGVFCRFAIQQLRHPGPHIDWKKGGGVSWIVFRRTRGIGAGHVNRVELSSAGPVSALLGRVDRALFFREKIENSRG